MNLHLLLTIGVLTIFHRSRFVRAQVKDTPIQFSDVCLERCPEVVRDWRNSECDSKKLGSCSCPYEGDKYCSLSCNYPSTNWSLMCIRSRPGLSDNSSKEPTISSKELTIKNHFTPFVTPPECVEKCPETDMKTDSQCDSETLGLCRCVRDDSPYCFHSCITDGVWAMICQENNPPPPLNDDRENSNISPYPTLDTTTPVPTPAVKVTKKESKHNKQPKVKRESKIGKKDKKETK